MDVPSDFYSALKAAYDSKQFDTACELVLNELKAKYPDEMASGLVDKQLIDMYLSVLEEQKIDLKTPGDVDLYLLEPAREKLFGIEEDEDDWGL